MPTAAGEEKDGAEATPSPTMTEDVAAAAATVDEEAGAGPEEADDLTVIKGIGPAVQTKLRSFGIASLAELAASDPEALAAKLRASQPISTTRVEGWIKAAGDRASSSS